ncbi:Cytochrome P450 86A2 [Phytophthora cinnamomi]|uniref:Cytochrome P450 86A2 n=1 Tax=Phytophthora cinnamomi TaxID=4785 RepID=UPI003559EC25|nr:Cytochrome P450 86A2 [Phytophthora cinnamomi]
MAFDHLALCGPSSAAEAIEHDPELFKKRVPNVLRLLFPRKLLWQWAARRLHLVPRNRRSGHDEERMASLMVSGLIQGNSPRFRRAEQTLYFVDMFGKKVLRYSLATESVGVVYEDIEDFVSAIGWLPDGRMLIVRMKTRQVLVLDQAAGCVQLYADVSGVTQFRANELVVAASGRVYLSNAGFDLAKMKSCCSTTLVSIDPVDRKVRVEATDLLLPNGMVITPDGRTLIVGEALAGRLTAFSINEDGALTDRRVWAKMGTLLGGISLDAEGCIWVSVPQMGAYESRGGALVRVREGGKVTDLLGFRRNGISRRVHACTLGLDVTGKVPHLYFVESVASKETSVLMHGRRTAHKNSTLKRTRVAVGPALVPSNPNYCGGY